MPKNARNAKKHIQNTGKTLQIDDFEPWHLFVKKYQITSKINKMHTTSHNPHFICGLTTTGRKKTNFNVVMKSQKRKKKKRE
jgi:hypothetical protein